MASFPTIRDGRLSCFAAPSALLKSSIRQPFPRLSANTTNATTCEEHHRALKSIRKVGRPRKDPVYGAGGPLVRSKNSSDAPPPFTLPPDGNNARVRPVARGIEQTRRDKCSYPEGTA